MLFALPPPAPAEAQAVATEEQELRRLYEELFQQLLAAPDNLDLLFQYAAVASRLGEYESAISSLERMLLLNPDLPRVKLELGALYLRLRSFELARAYFEAVRDDPTAPPEVQAKVAEFLAVIDGAAPGDRFAASLLIGGRYQTNANAGPVSDEVLAGGLDSVLDDEFRRQGDFALYGIGRVNYDSDILLGDGATDWGLDNDAIWQHEALAYYARQIELTDLNVGLVHLESGPRFEVVGDEGGSLLFLRPFVAFDVTSLGEEPFYIAGGAGLTVTADVSDSSVLIAGYEYRYRSFFQPNDSSGLTDLTGSEHLVFAEVLHVIDDTWSARLGGSFLLDGARTDFDTNRELAVFAGVSARYPAPIGQGSWLSSFTASGIISDYKAADPSVDPDVARLDKEVRLLLTNVVPLSDRFSLFGQVEYLNNTSNLPNFAYENVTVSAGLSVSF